MAYEFTFYIPEKISFYLSDHPDDIMYLIGFDFLLGPATGFANIHNNMMRRLPSGLKIPNQPTQKTILDAKSKKDIKSFDSAEELFENLDI